MSYTIAVSKDKKYIVVKVVGEITRASAMKQNIEAHQLGKKKGISRYLVDVRKARNTDSVLNNYEFAYDDVKASKDMDPDAKVATLINPGDPSHDFIITVTKNSGLNVKFFIDRKAATKYLLAD